MFSRKTERLDAAALREYALRLLAARSHTAAELRAKLKRRAMAQVDVDFVVAALREYGAVDDRRLAENFASSRRDSKGFGRQRVLTDLLKRRVAPTLARKTVDEAYRDTDETALVEDYLARKFRGRDLAAELQQPARLASVYRRLRTAGFASGAAIRVLKCYAAEAERLEGMEEAETEQDSGT
jgi:regulatory protein